MQARVKKWGNSLGIRIPQVIAEQLGISEDSPVELSTEDEVIIIKKIPQKESLRQLVSRITPINRHEETDWGSPAGQETW